MATRAALRPGISVVIPVKDRARLLTQTLRSVTEQSRPPVEIIVVDDGSTDDSAAVARSHGATVITTGARSAGPSAARNAGIARVATELVCPLDSDDLLMPHALEKLDDGLAGAPGAPFAFGEALEAAREATGWRPTGVIAPEPRELQDLLCSLYARNFVPASAVVARTDEIKRVGGYSGAMVFNEDHYLWLALATRGLPAYVGEVLAVSRRHSGSRHDPLAYAAVEEITNLATEDPRLRPCRAARQGVQLVNVTSAALRGRRPADAGKAAWRFLLSQPQRRRILRSAIDHSRLRRESPRRGENVWLANPELERFLSSYA